MNLWVKALAIFAVSSFFVDWASTLDDESFLRPNTPSNIEKLKNLGKNDLAEELSGQYQGDIIMSDKEIRELESQKNSKNGLINESRRWVNNIVPYRIDNSEFTQEQVDYIHKGASRIQEVSCLQFVSYDPNVHTDYITVQASASGCSSSVGRRGGSQFINLQPYDIETGCFRLYTIVHEFLHSLGFYHMQASSDRDNFVRINFDKIASQHEQNFNIYGSDVITHFGVDYDYGSVLHYSSTAFSIDGSETITALRDLNGEVMGQRAKISDKDILRLNRMYNCPETPPATEVPTTKAPTTKAPATNAPTTNAPTTNAPTTNAPTTNAPTTKAPATNAPTTNAPTTKTPATNAPTTKAPATVKTTDVPATEVPKCPAGNIAGHLPHENDCTLFYKCNGSVPVLMSCPSGLHFNRILEVCDYPYSAGCIV